MPTLCQQGVLNYAMACIRILEDQKKNHQGTRKSLLTDNSNYSIASADFMVLLHDALLCLLHCALLWFAPACLGGRTR